MGVPVVSLGVAFGGVFTSPGVQSLRVSESGETNILTNRSLPLGISLHVSPLTGYSMLPHCLLWFPCSWVCSSYLGWLTSYLVLHSACISVCSFVRQFTVCVSLTTPIHTFRHTGQKVNQRVLNSHYHHEMAATDHSGLSSNKAI